MLKRYQFKQHFDIFLELMQRIVLYKSAYGGLFGDKKKREERAKRFRIAIDFFECRHNDNVDSVDIKRVFD